MQFPALLPALALPSPYICRAATEADTLFLFALFADVRSPEFAPLGLPAPALEQLLAMQFRAQTTGYAAQHPGAESLIVLRGTEPVGRLLVHRSADALHIVDIALRAGARGTGLGTALLLQVVAHARAQSQPVTLEVRLGNPAERLYARLGFIAASQNDHSRTLIWRPAAIAL